MKVTIYTDDDKQKESINECPHLVERCLVRAFGVPADDFEFQFRRASDFQKNGYTVEAHGAPDKIKQPDMLAHKVINRTVYMARKAHRQAFEMRRRGHEKKSDDYEPARRRSERPDLM